MNQTLKLKFEEVIQNDDIESFLGLLKENEPPDHTPHTLLCFGQTEFVKKWMTNRKIKKNVLRELLHYAVRYDNLEIVKLALSMGANPNHNKGSNLCSACIHASIEIIQCLLDFGASVHTENKYGGTPIMFAANTRRKDIVSLFLKHGANINRVSKNGKTVYDGLIEYRKIEMVAWFLDELKDIIDPEKVKLLKKNRIRMLLNQ